MVTPTVFMGTYNHTVDAKGRLIMPAKFREQLGESFVVSRGMDGCLFVHTNEGWQAFEEKLKNLPMMSKDARRFQRFFNAGADNVELDKQGRVLLSQTHREFAGLDKDVVLAGVGDRIEIWSREKWEDATADDDMDSIADALEALGFRI